jgi:hypothetical protein
MNKFANISLKDQRYNYHYKGFCSVITTIIDIALEHYCEFKNFNWSVDDEQVLNFFEQNQKNKTEYYDAGSLFLDNMYAKKLLCYDHNAHTIADMDNLKLKNLIYINLLKIKKEYNEKFHAKFKSFNITQNTLGIHIRGTDKTTELPEVEENKIISKIDRYILHENIDKIFLSTDDLKYVRLLKNYFGSLIKFDESNLISSDSIPIHFGENKSRINEEVLCSAYILSRCSKFIYCFSNVSLLALIMGANNFKLIDNLNN